MHIEQRLTLGRALAPLLVLRQLEKAVRHAESEAARAEVDADPDLVFLISEHVHVVIARADGAELLARLGTQTVALVPVRHRVPGRILEQRIVGGRIVRAVPQAHAERQRGLNLVGQLTQPPPPLDLRQLQIGADRSVAAGDIESHADHGDLVAVRRDAADRHDIAQMPVRHERGALGAARDIAQLLQSVGLVRAEDCRRYGHNRYNVRGKAIASRMCGMPQIHATVRSTPSPNPACTNVPYLRRARYQLYASSGSFSARMRPSSLS